MAHTFSRSDELSFSILSLNVWGMPWKLSKDKDQRMDALANVLKGEPYKNLDVICFQELWLYSDYTTILNAIELHFPYGHFFRSGVVGSGLSIFSKWPLVRTFFHQWPLNGFAHKLLHADWYGGKGVALVQIKKSSRLINVFNLHMHATYGKERYTAHRIVQAFETATFVDLLSESADLTVVCGDFNSEPDDLCSRLIQNLPGLQDSHSFSGQKETLETYACNRNSYTSDLTEYSGRIDYILFKSRKGTSVRCLRYSYALPELIPETDISYSDHEAITSTFRLENCETGGDGDSELIEEHCSGIIDDLESAKLELVKASKYPMIFLCLAIFAVGAMDFLEHLIETVQLPRYLMFLCLRIPFWLTIIYATFMSSLWYWMETQTLASTESSINVVLGRLRLRNDK